MNNITSIYRDSTTQEVGHNHDTINNNRDVECMLTQYSPTYDKVAKFMKICQHSIRMTTKT